MIWAIITLIITILLFVLMLLISDEKAVFVCGRKFVFNSSGTNVNAHIGG